MIRYFLSCLLLLNLSVVWAQTEAPSSVDESLAAVPELPYFANGVGCRILNIGLIPGTESVHLLDASGQSLGVIGMEHARHSSLFQCPRVSGQLLFGIEDGVDEEGNLLYKTVAQVALKSNWDEVCLIFFPARFYEKSPKVMYRVLPLDMSIDAFKLGTTKVVNMTPKDIAIGVGEHKKRIKSMSMGVIPEVTQLGKLNTVQFSLYYFEGSEGKKIRTAKRRYLSHNRYFSVVYPDLKTNDYNEAFNLDDGLFYRNPHLSIPAM